MFQRLSFKLMQDCLRTGGDLMSVFKLRRTSHVCLAKAETIIWKKILYEILQVNLNEYMGVRAIPSSLFSPNVLLTGSSILQLTVNQSWPEADTDIF